MKSTLHIVLFIVYFLTVKVCSASEPTACPPNSSTSGIVNGNKVNVRETPDISGRVLMSLPMGMSIKILERKSDCLMINNGYGQWVKVRVGDNDSEGWAFDRYISYPANSLVTRTTVVHDTPGGRRQCETCTILIGEPARIEKNEGDWAFVVSSWIGWVHASDLIEISRFQPLSHWDSPQQLEVGDGDYGATYSFYPDGTFSVKESQLGADEVYRLVEQKGVLYQYKNFVWAKVSNEPIYSSRIFIRSKEGELCWREYVAYPTGNCTE